MDQTYQSRNLLYPSSFSSFPWQQVQPQLGMFPQQVQQSALPTPAMQGLPPNNYSILAGQPQMQANPFHPSWPSGASLPTSFNLQAPRIPSQMDNSGQFGLAYSQLNSMGPAYSDLTTQTLLAQLLMAHQSQASIPQQRIPVQTSFNGCFIGTAAQPPSAQMVPHPQPPTHQQVPSFPMSQFNGSLGMASAYQLPPAQIAQQIPQPFPYPMNLIPSGHNQAVLPAIHPAHSQPLHPTLQQQPVVSYNPPAPIAPIDMTQPKTESAPEDVFTQLPCGSRPMPSLALSLPEKTLSLPAGQPIAPVDAPDQLASIVAKLGRNIDSIPLKAFHPSSIPLASSVNALAAPVTHKQLVKAVHLYPIPHLPSDSVPVQTLAATLNIPHQQPLIASFHPSSILPLQINVEAAPAKIPHKSIAKSKRHRSCNGVQFVKSCPWTDETRDLLENRPKISLKMIKAEPADADQPCCSSTFQNSSTLKKTKPRQSLPLVMPDLLPRGPRGVSVSIEDKKARRKNYYQRYYINQKMRNAGLPVTAGAPRRRRQKAAEKKAEKDKILLESISEKKKDDDEEELEFVMESVENEEKRRERDAEATPPMIDPLSMKRGVSIGEELEQSTGEETMEEEIPEPMVLESVSAWTDEGMMEVFEADCDNEDLSRAEYRENSYVSSAQNSATFISTSDDDDDDGIKKDEDEEEMDVGENNLRGLDSFLSENKEEEEDQTAFRPLEVMDGDRAEEEESDETEDGTWILSWKDRYDFDTDSLTAELIAESNELYGNAHEEREEPPPSPLPPLF